MSLNFLNSAALTNRNMIKNYDFFKENAANFLDDFFNRKQVIEFLEM